jgi:hypothetical protein
MPSWALVLVELLCLGLVVAGIALIYVPGSLILAGVLGVVVCERWPSAVRR